MEKKAPWLGTPAGTIEILQKYGFHFQKKYGQNFLIDPHVLEKIIRIADISGDDCVLEIGPGIGTLTQYLAYAAKRVCTVEIDAMLIPILEETLRDWDNVTVIHADILKTDLDDLLRRCGDGRPVKVVANLPYYITTPILMTLLERRLPVSSITVMVQKEVADRMQAAPGTREYGALSLAVQYYTEPHLAAQVPPNCFIPRPGVGSAVIRLDCRQEAAWKVSDEKLLFALIRAAFGQRRKTLLNSVSHGLQAGGTAIPKESILAAIRRCGLPDAVRGEALSLEQFIQLTDILQKEMASPLQLENNQALSGGVQSPSEYASGRAGLEKSQ